MHAFDFQTITRVVFGVGAFARVGEIALEMGFRRTLLVADHGMVQCGYVEEAVKLLRRVSIESFFFHDFTENPDTAMVEAGRRAASQHGIDSIVALGGGSSLDCAKGINFVLSGGGAMHDYWGHGKLSAKPGSEPMLPMIGIPTTAGTGSDAQSYTLISDAGTHVKMACGDPQAVFKVVILDPQLTVTMPATLTATTGYDAISHAVESYVTKKRNPLSQMLSREAWRLLERNFERVLEDPKDIEARSAMLLGSYYAGLAVENSMLGATHACANPLTKNYGTTHGVAIAVMLPRVVRWNTVLVGEEYQCLRHAAGLPTGARLAGRLEELAKSGGLPGSLGALNVPRTDLSMLAAEAAEQWTGSFNPREWNIEGAMEVYEYAYE